MGLSVVEQDSARLIKVQQGSVRFIEVLVVV